MSSLLDDLKAEHHADLIENGNLRPAARAWTGENQWHDAGYLARVLVTTCACGISSSRLLAILHTEKTPSGKSKETALSPAVFLQFPPKHSSPILTQTEQVKICAHCLTTKGFLP